MGGGKGRWENETVPKRVRAVMERMAERGRENECAKGKSKSNTN